MIGVFNRLDGERVALQRTYLAADGDGKADVPSPKKTTATVREHALHGAAVRLTHIDSIKDRLALTEGIETGIAVLESTGVPTWATGCAGGLEHAIIPDRVGIVEIWGDNDAGGTGQKARSEEHTS